MRRSVSLLARTAPFGLPRAPRPPPSVPLSDSSKSLKASPARPKPAKLRNALSKDETLVHLTPLPPSATLVWHTLRQIEDYDRTRNGFCLRCRCPGHTTERCTAQQLSDEENFCNKHTAHSESEEGRPVCFAYHFYGLCEDASCDVGRCVACGGRHATHEHFQERHGRPRLPSDLPPFLTAPSRKPSRASSIADVLIEERARDRELDAHQRLLQKHVKRAISEAAAFDSWQSAGSPGLQHLITRFPVHKSASAARRAIYDRIPATLRKENALRSAARTREALRGG